MRSESPDGTVLVTGTVDADRSHAAYTVARLVTGRDAVTGVAAAAGPRPRPVVCRPRPPEAGLPAVVQTSPPAWWERALADDGLVVPGAVLTGVGLPVPVIGPAQGYLLDVRAC